MFDFRLALALGMTISEMKKKMPAVEYAAWKIYASVYPIGEERDDIRAAMIASVSANAMGAKSKIQDFILFDFKRPRRVKQNIVEQKSILQLALRQGSKTGK